MTGRPAARVTDMHVCPMTAGAPLPIVPPAAIRVLIGGMPAARMTDLCACVGPPPAPVDAILLGSFTVLIQGLPAARMGDPTAKGGAITTGWPTVLIGEAGVVPPMTVRVSPLCASLQMQLEANAAAQANAALADAAYAENPEPGSTEGLPEGYRRATQKDLEALGLHDGETDFTRRPGSDFRADLFVSEDASGNPHYTVAFQGSSTGEDWLNNALQGTGQRDSRLGRAARRRAGNDVDYYNEAAILARTAEGEAPGQVSYTGHSLGGGLASAAAGASGAPAHTFNAAGLHESTLEQIGRTGQPGNNIEAYFLEDDPLNKLQDSLGIAPDAYGNRRRMATVDDWTDADRQAGEEAVNPDNWIPDRLERRAGAEAARQLRFHGMGEMQKSLEAQASALQTLKALNGCP